MEQIQQKLKLTFPTRPQSSPRFQAKSIKLVSNRFSLTLSTKQPIIYSYDVKQPIIYLYDVKILNTSNDEQIPNDARRQRQDIIKSAIQKIKKIFGANCWCPSQAMWSTKNFSSSITIEAHFDNTTYAIVMTKAKEVNLKSETFKDNNTAASARQYLNVSNAKFYNPNQMNKIPFLHLPLKRQVRKQVRKRMMLYR